jgi:hypothetical protein
MFKLGCTSSKPFRFDGLVPDENKDFYRCWKYLGKPDLQLAAKWFRKAAEQGDAMAQNELGAMYSRGKGVPKSFPRCATPSPACHMKRHEELS